MLSDSGNILQMELVEFSNKLDVGCERRRGLTDSGLGAE